MSDPKRGDGTPPAPAPGPSVLHPAWEDVLRAGQSDDGGAGSVDAELAVVRLFRHAVGHEQAGSTVSDVWSEIEAEVTPAPWWTKLLDWRVATGVATAAAAAAVIVIAWPPVSPDRGAGDPASVAALSPGTVGTQLEAQFSMLEGPARSALAKGVDVSRGSVRSDLLALATRDPEVEALRRRETAGGAP